MCILEWWQIVRPVEPSTSFSRVVSFTGPGPISAACLFTNIRSSKRQRCVVRNRPIEINDRIRTRRINISTYIIRRCAPFCLSSRRRARPEFFLRDNNGKKLRRSYAIFAVPLYLFDRRRKSRVVIIRLRQTSTKLPLRARKENARYTLLIKNARRNGLIVIKYDVVSTAFRNIYA